MVLGLRPRTMAVAAVVAVVVAAAVAVAVLLRRRREKFSLGGLLNTITTGVVKAGQATVNFVVSKQKALAPQYVGRGWDGADWSCPQGTVETGLENARACIRSQFHPARPDGQCPIGTVPTGESNPGKKCEVGYAARIYLADKWVCPEGTDDTGNNWDKGWREGQKQCRRRRAYTMRYSKDGKFVCPENTTDTGRSYSHPTNGADQCKWNGNVA